MIELGQTAAAQAEHGLSVQDYFCGKGRDQQDIDTNSECEALKAVPELTIR